MKVITIESSAFGKPLNFDPFGHAEFIPFG